jgi:hypothetical protein
LGTLKFLIFLSIVAIIFAIPRGFDISDEGVYVMLADPNQENIGGIFNYDLFFKVLYKFTGLEFGIIGLRIIRLISYFIGAYGLALFWKNLFESQKLSLSIFLLALAGLFAGYGFLPPTLSYNSISVVSVCIWLGIISNSTLGPKSWLFLGLIFLVLFYSKITACLLLGLISILYLRAEKEFSLPKVLILISPWLIFEWLYYFLFKENGMTRLTGESGFISQRQDYSILLLIKYTVVGVFWSLTVGIFFFVIGKLRGFSGKLKSGMFLIGTLFLLFVFYKTRITEEWSHFFLLVIFALISWQLGASRIVAFNTKRGFFLFILICLPFLIHFGSNVYWMRLGTHYWVFWIFAFAILIQAKSNKSQTAFYQLIAVSSLLLVVTGIWITPFEGSYLWDSRYAWEYKTGRTILLAKPQIDFLNKLKSEIEPIESGNIASLYMNPGLLYLFDRTSPCIPGYWKSSQAKTFLRDGDQLELILFNPLDSFPFDQKKWEIKDELIQPNGEKLLVLWRK